MRTITVEPAQLDACAQRMDEKNADYVKTYTELFNTVDAMSAAWNGKDNAAFTNRILKFQSDFRQMSVLCTAYSDFLKNSARAYRETQDELASQAEMLQQ